MIKSIVFALLVSIIALVGCSYTPEDRARWALKERQAQEARERQAQQEQEAKEQKQRQHIANLKDQCLQYGAKADTSEMVQCILLLQQNETIAEANRQQYEALRQQIEANAAEARRRGWQDASRILNESTKITPISPPIDNSMSCRSYRNGMEIVTNCR